MSEPHQMPSTPRPVVLRSSTFNYFLEGARLARQQIRTGGAPNPKRPRSEPIYLAKVTEVGGTDQYKATQVLTDLTTPDDPLVWDGAEGNLPMLYQVAGPPAQPDDIVIVHSGLDSDGQVRWWFIMQGALPGGGQQYMVLQLAKVGETQDADDILAPTWDWVRAH